MKKLITDNCTGCSACASVCEKHAIGMIPDQWGFRYPVIDQEKCVDCGRCNQVCTSRLLKRNLPEVPRVYAMYSKDQEIRLRSTSGGIFSELAKRILDQKGYVAGAAYKPDWSVEHCIIHTRSELEQLRRSKYQQSNITDTLWKEIKVILESGAPVLFSGAPCQAGGLRAYLGKSYENLYICDFICRGVSSPRLFYEYICTLRQDYKSEISYIWMKNKCYGWHDLTTKIGFENGESYVKRGADDSYARLYLKYNLGVRKSCYTCSFKENNDVADITLGDFWGLDDPGLDDNLGTSAVICRTSRGKSLVKSILSRQVFQERTMEEVVKGNPCLLTSIGECRADEERFLRVLTEQGYKQAAEIIGD